MEFNQLKRCYKQDGSGRDKALEGYKQILADLGDDGIKDIGEKLICLAADFAHPEALKLLFNSGISAPINDRGYTLLHVLARKKESFYCKKPNGAVKQCVDILLDKNIGILKKDVDGKVCYHYAARHGTYEFVEALSMHGAKLNITDKQGNTGIHIAAKEVGQTIFDIENAEKKIQKAKADYIKIVAKQKNCGKTDAEITEYIQKFMDGLTPNADKEQETLAEAVKALEGYFLTVKAFAEDGVDKNEKNNYESTALDYAIESGAKKIAAYLSDTLTEDDASIAASGLTLHQAAQKGDVGAIIALVSSGIDLNAIKDGDKKLFGGCTALAIACAYLQHEAVNVLLTNGADPLFKNGDGRVAIDFLVHDVKVSLSAKIFEEKRIWKIINDMICASFDINKTVNDDGDTLLISVCKSMRTVGINNRSLKGDLLDAVLAQKPDVNLTNRYGETALMHSCAHDFNLMENVQVELLERGANVTVTDIKGNTALHYAAQNSDKNGSKVLCEMLLAFGADANAVNNAGQTALSIAAEANNESLVKLLLKQI